MKRILILPILCIIILSSCSEVGPPINLTPPSADSLIKDTSYITTVETPQAHNVLIEDFTGVSCPNCPAGHDVISGIVAQNPSRVNVLAIYPYNFGQAEPIPNLTLQDFRTQLGTQIDNIIYGTIGFMPSAGVDRIPESGSLLLNESDWVATVNSRLTYVTPVNLKVSSTYSNNQAVITATVSFTQTVTTKQNLSIAIVEDSIIDAQDNQGVYDSAYLFTNVLRDIATVQSPPYGNTILAAQDTIVAGTVYAQTITYSIPTAGIGVWNPAHCKVIAFVNYTNSAGNKDVLQSASCKLTGP